MRQTIFFCAVSLLLGGCASSSVMDLDSSTIQISTSAAPACGATGAQKVATRRAAIETLRRGYDRYVIMGGGYANNVGVVGYTPLTANTYGSGTVSAYGNNAYLSGQSTTSYSGGQPIIAGSHDQQLTVRMFRETDPGAENAIDAKRVLGPEWQEALNKSDTTC
jgi:uncharacterized protein YceK